MLRWEMDTIHHLDDGSTQGSTREINFGWVPEGRAIQDIWIRPKRSAPFEMYGTTLRIFDSGIGGWHITWSDTLNQDYSGQVGRAEGKDIVQMGDDSRRQKNSMAVHRDHCRQLPIGSAAKDIPMHQRAGISAANEGKKLRSDRHHSISQ